MDYHLKSNSFSFKNWMVLFALALLSTFMFEHSDVDIAISNLFYHNGHWLIEKNAQPWRAVFYDLPKKLLIVFGVWLIVSLLIKWLLKQRIKGLNNRSRTKIALNDLIMLFDRLSLPFSPCELSYILISMIAVPSLMATLKALTHVACPNQLLLFSGHFAYLSLWQDYITQTPAKCFPAAHASAGFALYAIAYLPRFRHLKVNIILLVTFLSWTMGAYKMLIGDHFFSHTLVSMWLSLCLVYGLAGFTFKKGV